MANNHGAYKCPASVTRLFALTALWLLSTAVFSADSPPRLNLTYFEAGTVWAGPGQTFSPGAILVQNGRIVHVGQPMELSEKASVHKLPDAVIMPPFIDAQTAIGLADSAMANEQEKAVYPDFKIADALNNTRLNPRMILEEGVLGFYVSPGDKAVLGGLGAHIDLSRRSVNNGFLSLSLTGSALYRAKKPMALSGLGEMLRKEVPDACGDAQTLRFYVDTINQVEMACDFAGTLNARPVLLGMARPDLLAPLPAAKKAIVIPKPTITPSQLKRMADASRKGVQFAFGSWAMDVWHVNVRFLASLAHHYGMPREAALKALTTNAAAACNWKSDGSLAEGQWADFVVYGGDPLDLSTPLLMLVSNGRTQHQTKKGVKS